MILLDTSVLSAALRRRRPGPADTRIARALSNLLATGERIAVPGLVLQEILSGIREEPQFVRIRTVLLRGYPIILADAEDHLLAAVILNGCRRKGVIVSSADALLAAIAINRGARLFAVDRDFARIAEVFPLKLLESAP